MCNKVSFRKKEAESALKKIGKIRKQYRREKRTYYCSSCNAWHLTSKD